MQLSHLITNKGCCKIGHFWKMKTHSCIKVISKLVEHVSVCVGFVYTCVRGLKDETNLVLVMLFFPLFILFKTSPATV